MKAGAARGLLLLCVVALRATAQAAPPEVRLEAGYARVDQDGFRPANAALFAIFWRKPTDRWTFFTSGNVTYARDSLAAAQGVAAFAIPWESNEHIRTDFGFSAASFSLSSSGRGGNGSGFVRQQYVRDLWGSWAGLAAGLSARDRRWSRSFAADAGAWVRWRFLFASASLARHGSDDFPLLYASGGTSAPFAQMYELEDFQVVAQGRRGPHELSVSFTTRRGVAGTDAGGTALNVGGILQLTERVALLASTGKQVADPVRGLPQAEITTAAIRVSLGKKLLPEMLRATIAEATVLRHVGGGGELEVRIFAHDTLRVELAGDFSGWRPVPLTREGSVRIARMTLPPGKYHVGVRANGGPWRAPRNLARVKDDFGGESGLLVIP